MAGLSKRLEPLIISIPKSSKTGAVSKYHILPLPMPQTHGNNTTTKSYKIAVSANVQMGYLGWWWLKSFAIPSLKLDASNHGRTQKPKARKGHTFTGLKTSPGILAFPLASVDFNGNHSETGGNLSVSFFDILGIFTITWNIEVFILYMWLHILRWFTLTFILHFVLLQLIYFSDNFCKAKWQVLAMKTEQVV